MKIYFVDEIELELSRHDRPRIVKKQFGKHVDFFLNWACINNKKKIKRLNIPIIIEDGIRDETLHLFLITNINKVSNYSKEDQKIFFSSLDVRPNDWVIMMVSAVKAGVDLKYMVGESIVKFYQISISGIASDGFMPVPYEKEEIGEVIEEEMQDFVHEMLRGNRRQ